MKSISALLFTLICLSCSSDQKERTFEQKDKNFYPVASFVKTELAIVDSLPVAVFKITTASGKSDTGIIEKTVLREKAALLLEPDITVPPLKDLYKESVFMDETINSITLSYSTEDADVAIRKIDVYVHPETEKVRSVYFEKNEMKGDSSIIRKMIWTAGKHLQVTSIISIKSQATFTLQEKYVWSTLE